MKDFAKSIVCNTKIGNADEVVHRDGNFKVKFNEKEKGYEVYYNSSYYDTFHTKDQALGFIEKWKKREADRKTGNIKQDAKAKKLYEEMMDAKELAEEWSRATHTQKKDNLEGGRKAAEDAYKKAKKAYEDYAMNSKVGNAWTSQKEKRLDELARKGPSKMTRQEWEEFLRLEKESSLENQKFVKSLSKNSKTENTKNVYSKDRYIIEEIDGGKFHLFDSKTKVTYGTYSDLGKAKTKIEELIKEDKIWGNSEIGNELNTGDFFKRLAADAHKEETRDNEKLNEIGNSDSLIGKTVWVRLSDGHKYKAEVLRDEGSRIYVKTPEGNQTWKLKREVEVLNEDSYEAWKNKPAKKIGNKGRINFDDDIVLIKKNGNILYKGMQDYAGDDDIHWQYNESKGIYEAPGGLTKEKIG